MHFTAPSIALLALAAGVQAGGAKEQHEPPVRSGKSIGKHYSTDAATGAVTGIPGHETGIVGTGVHTGSHPIVTGSPHNNGTQTGSHPIVTGSPHHNGTNGGGSDHTIIGTGTAPCYSCHGSATIPVYVPTKTNGASATGGAGGSHGGSGSGSDSGASPSGGAGSGSGLGSDDSAEYTPSNPGSKVTAPQVGVFAVIGSIIYGAVMLLA
ncbi:hypothetical protein N7447_009581 [Penicillium robsamsonii]|uniref:uncharacterized protein n=1 Tax=Penicillium robsamsonii TaxID=1792511 RepID=UPI0025499F38|nr:uncharacterized protein N7447_009581 [Penicillium robsamsonii]KAJ5817348.1 hypothetical protein N7447_009581 [Penicillium robsamsonii]